MEVPLQGAGMSGAVEKRRELGVGLARRARELEELLDMGRIATDQAEVVEGALAVVLSLMPGRGPAAVDRRQQVAHPVAVLEPGSDRRAPLAVEAGVRLVHDPLPVGEDGLHGVLVPAFRRRRAGRVGGGRPAAAAIGARQVRDEMGRYPLPVVGLGLLTAVTAGLIGLYGGGFFKGVWLKFELGETLIKVGTPQLFDLGVMLVVVGMGVTFLLNLSDTADDVENPGEELQGEQP